MNPSLDTSNSHSLTPGDIAMQHSFSFSQHLASEFDSELWRNARDLMFKPDDDDPPPSAPPAPASDTPAPTIVYTPGEGTIIIPPAGQEPNGDTTNDQYTRY